MPSRPGITGASDPAANLLAVTPSDTVSLPVVTRALYIGVTGDVSVEGATLGSAIVFKGVQAGSTLPIQVSRVNATGTTATDIVALW